MDAARRAVPAMLLLSATCLLVGMLSPVLRVASFWVFESETSLIDGVWQLLRGGSVGLGLFIGAFSIVLPLVKLAIIARAHGLMQQRRRPRAWWMVAVLGKWSMLDVFVIATVMGCIQLGVLSEARAAHGLYWFFLGVMLSMGAALLLAGEGGPTGPAVARKGRGRQLALLRLLILVPGLTLPLMSVSKWWFWSQDFSLLSVMPAMWASGEWVLPGVLLLFVVIMPAFSLLLELESPWLHRRVDITFVREFSMLDVFVVGMSVVFIKLGADAQAVPGIGFVLLWVYVLLDWWAAACHARQVGSESS